MSTYSPSLPRTAELHGLDRLLVRVGTRLTDVGRRRAEARAHLLATRAARAATDRARHEVGVQHLDRLRDNAAQEHPLLLR